MIEDKAQELARLQAMLAVREGKSGYATNVVAIKARIAELKADLDLAG